jgi:hypothetical protein
VQRSMGSVPVNKTGRLAETLVFSRRLAFAAAAFFVASTGLGHAQSGAFAGLAGSWSGAAPLRWMMVRASASAVAPPTRSPVPT